MRERLRNRVKKSDVSARSRRSAVEGRIQENIRGHRIDDGTKESLAMLCLLLITRVVVHVRAIG